MRPAGQATKSVGGLGVVGSPRQLKPSESFADGVRSHSPLCSKGQCKPHVQWMSLHSKRHWETLAQFTVALTWWRLEREVSLVTSSKIQGGPQHSVPFDFLLFCCPIVTRWLPRFQTLCLPSMDSWRKKMEQRERSVWGVGERVRPPEPRWGQFFCFALGMNCWACSPKRRESSSA